MVERGFYTGIWEGRVVKAKGPYADRVECSACYARVGNRCITLIDTNWIRGECPFLATESRLLKDKELLDRAIKEGRINVEKYGGA